MLSSVVACERVSACGWCKYGYLLSDIIGDVVILKGEHQLIGCEHQLLLAHAAAKFLRPEEWMLIIKINKVLLKIKHNPLTHTTNMGMTNAEVAFS